MFCKVFTLRNSLYSLYSVELSLGCLLFFALGSPALAQTPSTNEAPHFLGALSCSSSSCHGGGGQNQNQYHVWSLKDYHSRSYATLTTARSARIAETLRLPNPAQSVRCTVCHAPLQNLPEDRRAPGVDPIQGVSCETCHNAAGAWVRSHTRKDFSHAQRVAAGVRDLKDIYVRANTCVACHQVVDSDLLRAGHPEIIFELDGQSVSEPPHWQKAKEEQGPQLWLVGQAAAFREMSAQLIREKSPESTQVEAWQGLGWLLSHASAALSNAIPAMPIAAEPNPSNFSSAQQSADQLARKIAELAWTPALTHQLLQKLSNSQQDFFDRKTQRSVQARRGERLSLALDRLSLALDKPETFHQELDALYQSVQSLPDFVPANFAQLVSRFAARLPESSPR